MQEFVKSNGSARVPQLFRTKDGFTLGVWVVRQRTTKNSMSVENRKLLELSCKDWSWDILTDKWNEGFAHLQEFVKKNGSARVEVAFKTKDGFSLGKWVSRQRTTKDELSEERSSLLALLHGWAWDVRDHWDEYFGLLREFVKKNGSARVPQRFKTKDGFPLGAWVSTQKSNKDLISAERRKLLESSCKDWTWDARS